MKIGTLKTVCKKTVSGKMASLMVFLANLSDVCKYDIQAENAMISGTAEYSRQVRMDEDRC